MRFLQKLIDTNVILDFPEVVNEKDIVIHSIILEEIDNINHNSQSEEKKFKARQARNAIKKNRDNIIFSTHSPAFALPIGWDNSKNDNRIIAVCVDMKYILVTNDMAMQIKAESIGVSWEEYGEVEKPTETYLGYKDITLDDYEMSLFYQCPVNKWGLLHNEYLVIRNSDGEIVDKKRWTKDKGFVVVKSNKISSMYMGDIKPRNYQQELAFDMFQNKDVMVKVVFGKYGSGKDLLMSAHALFLLQKGVIDKIVFVRNNYGVKNSKEIGFLPGSQTEKLLPYAMPLADHVGGVEGLTMLINQGKVELQHLGFMRGRNIARTLIYCTEAENMTKEHIRLLIGRLAEGSMIWLNGDFKQIDDNIFERNNGLQHIINRLRGNELFSCVNFDITERSKTAQLADLLD
jgi:PhoH-like ATPase